MKYLTTPINIAPNPLQLAVYAWLLTWFGLGSLNIIGLLTQLLLP